MVMNLASHRNLGVLVGLALIPCTDETWVPAFTGMAIDLRKPTKARCLTWLRNTLLSLEETGVIEATEERNPPHFHVAIFPTPYARYVARNTGGTVRLATTTTTRTTTTTTRTTTPASAARPTDGRTYRVRRGDSLWTIAQASNVSVDRLKSANSMTTSRIVAGQVLTIPN